jgi:hypothetical protein
LVDAGPASIEIVSSCPVSKHSRRPNRDAVHYDGVAATWEHQMFTHWFRYLSGGLGKHKRTPRKQRGTGTRRFGPLAVKSLEGRVMPSAAPLVALSYFDSAVYKFNATTGALQATLVAPYSQSILDGPSGMTVGPDGNLYFSSQLNNSIVEYNLSTKTLSTFIDSTVMQPIASSYGDSNFAPAGLAFGPDNELYVSLNAGHTATSGGAVVRFNISATHGHLIYAGSYAGVASGLVQPTEMTFGVGTGADNLLVSNSVDDEVIQIADATGASPTSSVFIAPSSGGMNYPSGLTWGPDGDLYVVDLGATNGVGQVLKFSPTGNFIKVFTKGSALTDQFPSDAIFLPNGDLLTANLGLNYPPNLTGSISMFGPAGAFKKTLDSSSLFPNTGPGTSGFSPSQIVLDGAQPLTLIQLGATADTVGVAYHETASTVGGSGTVTLTVSNIQNAIPGLKISGNGTNTITISGTPRFAGTETFQVTAKDSNGDTTVRTYSVTVNPAISLSTLVVPAGLANSAYQPFNITASGGTGTVTLTVSDIDNPVPGLTITGSGTGTVQISGTPTDVGLESFTVTATDSVGATTVWTYLVLIL